MAKSGIIYGPRGGNAYGPRLELHWTVISQDVAKNTTRLKVTSVFNVDGATSYDGNAGKVGSTTISGNTQSYTSPTHNRTARTRTLGITYHTVSHNADGSFSGTLSGTFNLGTITWGGTTLTRISASGSITLDTIVRGIDGSSVKLATGWTDTTSTKTVTFTKYSSTATVEIYWRYWNAKTNSWTSWISISTSYTSGAAITLNAANVNDMHFYNPDTKTAKVEVKVEHYQGTALLGEIIKSTTLTLKASSITFTFTATCSGKNQSLLGGANRAVQGVHDVALVITSASSTNGALIKKHSITFQNTTTLGSSVTRKVTDSGTLTAAAKVVDSRGYVRIATINVISYPYRYPYPSLLTAKRYTGTTVDPYGTDYKIIGKIVGSVIAPDGADVNTVAWRVSGGTITYSPNILYTGTLAVERTISFNVQYWDAFLGPFDYVVTIPTGQASLILGKESVGVGMLPPADTKGLHVKDGIYNNPFIGGIIATTNPEIDAEKIPTNSVKAFMTDTAQLIDNMEQYGYGFLSKRGEAMYITFYTHSNRIFQKYKPGSSEPWSPWIKSGGYVTRELTLYPDFAVGFGSSLSVVMSDNIVSLEGAIKKTTGSIASGDTIAMLPTFLKPYQNTIFVTPAAGGIYAQIRVLTTGEIKIYTAIAANTWVSLSGINFRI